MEQGAKLVICLGHGVKCVIHTLELRIVKWVSELMFVKVYSMTLEQILAGYLVNPYGEEL